MGKEQWFLTTKRADFQAIGEKFGIDPVIARILRNRDITGEEEIRTFLYGTVRDLHDPMLMRDMDAAVSILSKKIADGAPVRIIGDYDIDGVMSSWILDSGIRSLGGNCDVRIPHRVRDGYGISGKMVDEAAADGIDTIVTCDNGIAAFEQIQKAKTYGMTVIVTDHHEVAGIPEADAVLNPHRPDCSYPYKNLCGAGVAYKLISALYRVFSEEEKAWPYLAFAAFATIGDIVDLTGENRIIVKEGLKRLRNTDHTGLKALCLACGMEPPQIDPYRIGFVLGPCINAGGRLDSAMLPFELMQTEDPGRAEEIALSLKELNESRKALTDEAAEMAAAEVEKGGCGEKVFVIYLPECHESIAGIVAGRIRERYDHPAYVLTRSGEYVKGSGRSVDSYSMFEELSRCSDLLVRYGGHPMAAGLTLTENNISALRKRLNDNCPLSPDAFFSKVKIDAAMPLRYVSEELIRQLEMLAPFGKGNPEPLFAQKGLSAENPRLIGARKNVLKMRLRSSDGTVMDGICFRDAEEHFKQVTANPVIMAAYVPVINEFNGSRTLQAEIRYIQ